MRSATNDEDDHVQNRGECDHNGQETDVVGHLDQLPVLLLEIPQCDFLP